jgi:hypothetical protein
MLLRGEPFMKPRSAFAFVLVALVVAAPHVVRAQPGGDAPADDPEPPVDIGMPTDDAPPADDTQPADDAAPAEDAPPVRDPKAAKKLADGASKFAKKGDKLVKRKKDAEAQAEYERAIAAYDKSFELYPDARVLVTSAALEVKRGRFLEAHARLERALAETEVPLDDKTRARAQAMDEEAKLRLGIVVLTIVPEGAMISIDGVEIGAAPLAKPIVLAPGEHQLSVAADGFVTLEQKLVVDEGSESERTFELQPVPVVVKPPAPPPPPPPPPLPPPPSKLPVWAGAGATLLFTAGAVTTGFFALGEHGTFTDENATDDARDDAQSAGKRYARMSDVFTGVAVVAAGFTAYYYLKVYRPKAANRSRLEREREGSHDELSDRRGKSRRPKLVVMPTVQASGGGLVIGGWF